MGMGHRAVLRHCGGMLSRKRVLVLRAAHQGSELAARLREQGLEPLLIPALEMVEPSSFAALDAALARLRQFDWLLFSSANAAEAVARRVGQSGLQFAGKVAAIGPGTARSLLQLGLQVDLVPPKAVAEAFAAALLERIANDVQRPARLLLIRAEEGRDHLPQTLSAAGAEVTVAAAYRTVVPEASVHLLRASLQGAEPAPDAIAFTSSSSVLNLLTLCEAAAVEVPTAALRISIGPITSGTLAERGYPADAEAAEATVHSLAATVAAALRQR